MCECSAAEVAGHLLLGPLRAAVSCCLVLPQRPLAAHPGGALGALLLAPPRQGAALHVGQHSTLVGKRLLAPLAGVGLQGVCGGSSRSSSSSSYGSIRACSAVLVSVLLFVVLLLLCGCSAARTFRLWRWTEKIWLETSYMLRKCRLLALVHHRAQEKYLHFVSWMDPAASSPPSRPAVGAVLWANWRGRRPEWCAAGGGATLG